MKNNHIIKGDINKTILKLALPMVAAFLLQTSFNIVDGIYVGRISADALAAISISFPVIFLMIALGAGVGTGTTSIIARSIGAKYFKKANNVAEHSVLLAIVFSLIFSLGGLFFGRYLFSIITTDVNLLNLVLDYSNIIFAGSIFMFLAFVANHILRGGGDMKTPMFIMGGSAILNIILDPIFIFTLGMGIKGAAYATVISRFIACVAVFVYIFKDKAFIKLNPKNFKYDFKIIKEILHIGIPSSLSQVIGSLSLFILTMIIAKFGSEAVAAYGVVFRIEGIVFMPIIGFMVALITFVGQNFGAGKIDRVRKGVFNSSLMTAAFSFFVGLLFFIFSKPLALLFNNDPKVVYYVSMFFLINFLTYPFFAVTMVIIGSFLGMGKPFPPLTINILRLLVIMVPLAFFLSSIYGVIGVWIAIATATTLSSITSFIWFRIFDFKK